MALLCDRQISERVEREGMIEPFFPALVNRGHDGNRLVSYGLSSYGYDMRIAPEYKIFTNVNNSLIDPKNFDDNAFVEHTGEHCIIPPNSFALGASMEYFRIPRDVSALCIGKSTYARCGIIINITPLEAGWEGRLTIEISNTTPLPARIYSGEGIAQVLFFEGSQPCEVSYADREGKYMSQQGIVLPKV